MNSNFSSYIIIYSDSGVFWDTLYNGKVAERFYYLRPLELFDGKTISAFAKEVVNEISQSSEGCIVVSLGADGVRVMSGEFPGVARLLRA